MSYNGWIVSRFLLGLFKNALDVYTEALAISQLHYQTKVMSGLEGEETKGGGRRGGRRGRQHQEEMSEDDYELFYMIGKSYYFMGDSTNAIKNLITSHELHPTKATALLLCFP